jgi:hypothetical protein
LIAEYVKRRGGGGSGEEQEAAPASAYPPEIVEKQLSARFGQLRIAVGRSALIVLKLGFINLQKANSLNLW